MDYAAALKAIKALDADNAEELVSAIEGKVGSLESKNFEIIGEKRNATTKAQSMQSALEAIASSLGIQGDLDAILETAQSKVTGLASEAAQLREAKTALEAAKAEAEGKVTAFERKGKLSQIATAAGANAAVLEKLFSDRLDELKVEGEGESRVVKLGDRALKEYVEADEGLKAFAPALFPSTEAPAQKPQPKLPSGGPKGTNEANPVDSYMSKTYKGINKFVKPSN